MLKTMLPEGVNLDILKNQNTYSRYITGRLHYDILQNTSDCSSEWLRWVRLGFYGVHRARATCVFLTYQSTNTSTTNKLR